MQTTETYLEVEKLWRKIHGDAARLWRVSGDTLSLRVRSFTVFTGSEAEALAYAKGVLDGMHLGD